MATRRKRPGRPKAAKRASKKAPKKVRKKTAKKPVKKARRRGKGPTVASLAKHKLPQLLSLDSKIRKAIALKTKKAKTFIGPRWNKAAYNSAQQRQIQQLFEEGAGGGI